MVQRLSLRLADGGGFLAAGTRLQDGGHIPGSGRGDKIPAKYEPGEFVVSNDMIDDNPGLREQLSELRAETLAARGKTVEQADAQAIRGGRRPSLRAADGFVDDFYRGQATAADRAAAQASANTARNAALPPSAATMTQGADGVTPPGQKYPGRALVVAGERAVTAPQNAPTGPSTALVRTSDIGNNGYKPNFTMGGTPPPQPSVAPGAAGPAGPVGSAGPAGPSMRRSAWDAFTGNTKNMMGPQPRPGILARTGDAALRGAGKLSTVAMKSVPVLGGIAALGSEALDVARVARDPNSTGIDVATQVAEGGGKLGTAALGAKAGALAGGFGGVAAPVTVPLGAAIGGLAGYYGGEKLIEGGRSLLGSDPDSPAEQTARAEALRGGGAGRGYVNPPLADPNARATTPAPANDPSNVIKTVGPDGRVSYSGGPNISGGITVNGKTPGGGGISAQNMAAADNLQARETLRGMSGAGASFPGRPVMPSAQHSGNSWEAANNLRNLRVGASSIYDNQSHWGDKKAAEMKRSAYANALNADTALRGGMDPGSIARTNAAASMYASDNSLRGTMASAGANRASAEARLRYDMDKDARDFNLRSEEAGFKRQETQLKQREASEKSVYDQILNTLPPGPDGKPDTAAAAEYMRGLSARVADRQTKLEAHLAANPGDKQAQSELQNIMVRGVGALGQRSKDMFLTGMEAKGLRKASSGMAPWAGRDIATNRPITSLRRDPGLIWDDYVDDQGGRIPAYAIDKEGAGLFGLGGRPSNKFDPLKER